MYPHKLLSSYKEKSSEESDNWLVIKINMTEEKICICVPPDVTFWERHNIAYTVFQLEMLISNIIFKEKLDKLKTMIILLKHVIKDKERLWKCSRLKETKERWQLKTVPHLRLHLLLEEKYAIKDIIGSIDKIVIQKVDQRRVSYQC